MYTVFMCACMFAGKHVLGMHGPPCMYIYSYASMYVHVHAHTSISLCMLVYMLNAFTYACMYI